jgi:hypothetical protein
MFLFHYYLNNVTRKIDLVFLTKTILNFVLWKNCNLNIAMNRYNLYSKKL